MPALRSGQSMGGWAGSCGVDGTTGTGWLVAADGDGSDVFVVGAALQDIARPANSASGRTRWRNRRTENGDPVRAPSESAFLGEQSTLQRYARPTATSRS